MIPTWYGAVACPSTGTARFFARVPGTALYQPEYRTPCCKHPSTEHRAPGTTLVAVGILKLSGFLAHIACPRAGAGYVGEPTEALPD